MTRRMLAAALLVGIAASLAAARPVAIWPYEQLVKEADLVVIATATASADSGELSRANMFKAKYIGVNTTFEVHGILKGMHQGGKLTLLHYRVEAPIINGPCHVTFRTEGFAIQLNGPEFAKIGLAPPQYMLFLKQRKDGRYEPVTGQDDPDQSVREMFPAGGASRVLERIEKKRK